MKRIWTFSLLAALAGLCAAEDMTLADGTVLREARVRRQDDESVTIAHAEGVVRVSFDRLTADLQKRFNLTPEAVNERREKAIQAEKEKELALEKKKAEQRAALAESNLSPRYLTGVDVATLYVTCGGVSATMAEYLAAEWNRREALRCGLTVEAERYKEDAVKLLPDVKKEQDEARQVQDYYARLEAHCRESQSQMQTLQQQLKDARASIKKLEEQVEQAEREAASQKTTTTIVTSPTVVPVYRPAPIVLPPVAPRPPLPPRPSVPAVRPAPAPVPGAVRVPIQQRPVQRGGVR